VIVYELQSDPDNYGVLLHEDERDLDVILDAFDGSSMADGWRRLRFRWETGRSRKPIPDFTEVGQGPVFGSHAIDVLGALLNGHGELLPIEVTDDGEPTIFNVTDVRDALDEEASDLERFHDGRVMIIDAYVLRPEELDGATIFKLPEQRARTYVTDRFVGPAREAGLTGMRFIERWRDE
jgi:uncharacterized protein DUF1629